jgi:hypothetical protein
VTEESNLVRHAREELRRCGQTEEDPEFSAALIAAVEGFASYGHSGSSAAAGVEMLSRLLRFQPLSPLTSDPSEWIDRSDVMGEAIWQSTRNPAAFSRDGGETWEEAP